MAVKIVIGTGAFGKGKFARRYLTIWSYHSVGDIKHM